MAIQIWVLTSVLGCSIEGRNAKILFDPFEKEFHAPTALVKLRNRQGRKRKVVGEEDKAFLGIRIKVTDGPKRFRIRFGSFGTFENDGLVARRPVGLST